jgi:hypothetical protein
MIYDGIKLSGYLSLNFGFRPEEVQLLWMSFDPELKPQPESWKSDAWAGEPQERRKEDPGSPARWNSPSCIDLIHLKEL